jgi:hypothetical protein
VKLDKSKVTCNSLERGVFLFTRMRFADVKRFSTFATLVVSKSKLDKSLTLNEKTTSVPGNEFLDCASLSRIQMSRCASDPHLYDAEDIPNGIRI